MCFAVCTVVCTMCYITFDLFIYTGFSINQKKEDLLLTSCQEDPRLGALKIGACALAVIFLSICSRTILEGGSERNFSGCPYRMYADTTP